MNAVFNINRFLNLEKRNLLTHKNQFIYASLIIIGFTLFTLLLFFIIPSLGQFVAWFIYPLCFILIACAPCFFEKNIQKNNSIFDFILPGSTFEKFLIMLINYVIILPVLCFGIVFLLVSLIGIIPLDNIEYFHESLLFENHIALWTIYKLIVFQSIFFTGYLFFKRFSFIKTLLILIAVAIFFLVVTSIMGFTMFSNMDTFNNASTMSIHNDELSLILENKLYIPKIILGIIFPVGLWIVGFFKLREKEI